MPTTVIVGAGPTLGLSVGNVFRHTASPSALGTGPP